MPRSEVTKTLRKKVRALAKTRLAIPRGAGAATEGPVRLFARRICHSFNDAEKQVILDGGDLPGWMPKAVLQEAYLRPWQELMRPEELPADPAEQPGEEPLAEPAEQPGDEPLAEAAAPPAAEPSDANKAQLKGFYVFFFWIGLLWIAMVRVCYGLLCFFFGLLWIAMDLYGILWILFFLLVTGGEEGKHSRLQGL